MVAHSVFIRKVVWISRGDIVTARLFRILSSSGERRRMIMGRWDRWSYAEHRCAIRSEARDIRLPIREFFRFAVAQFLVRINLRIQRRGIRSTAGAHSVCPPR